MVINFSCWCIPGSYYFLRKFLTNGSNLFIITYHEKADFNKFILGLSISTKAGRYFRSTGDQAREAIKKFEGVINFFHRNARRFLQRLVTRKGRQSIIMACTAVLRFCWLRQLWIYFTYIERKQTPSKRKRRRHLKVLAWRLLSEVKSKTRMNLRQFEIWSILSGLSEKTYTF